MNCPALIQRGVVSVHHVLWLPLQKGLHVFGRGAHQPLPGLAGGPGDVGGDHDAAGGQERVVRPDRFRRHHVHHRRRDAPGVECPGQVALVHERAAGGVDQHGRRLHAVQEVRVDERVVFGRERAVQADHVACGEEFLEGGPGERRIARIRSSECVMRHYAHPEGVGQFPDPAADAAEAHDSHGLAAQLDQRRLPERPVRLRAPLPGLYGVGVDGDVVPDVQEGRKHVLGDGVRPVDRHVRHRDTAAAGRRDVHAVVARRGHADVPQPGKLRQGLLADAGLVDDEDLRLAAARRQLRRRGALVNGKCSQGCDFVPGIVARVEGETVGCDDASGCHGYPSVHPEMVDFGSGQGRSDFAPAGVVLLRRGLRRARTPAWAERCRLWMDTILNPAQSAACR